jgi:HPt (histidine-containing phosphotransfer) domain-containing protein
MLLDIVRTIDATEAPSLAPDDRPIDLVHLARTTLGDRSLEREVLQLFDRQSTLLIARMRSAAPGGIATLAHTLKGSARGIGAWRVARAAEALEFAGTSASDVGGALDRLAAASDEARAVIAELLRAN